MIETIDKKGDKIKVRHILSIPEKTAEDNKRAYNFAMSLKQDSIKTLEDFKIQVKKHTFDESTSKIGGDLGWRLDTGLIVALLRLVLVEYLLACLAQIGIRSLQVLGLRLI